MPETNDKNKGRRARAAEVARTAQAARARATGEALRGLLGAMLQPSGSTKKPVDGAHASGVESASDLQKSVDPGFAPEVDRQRVRSTPPNESRTLRSKIPDVKRLPSDRPDSVPGGIPMTMPDGDGNGDGNERSGEGSGSDAGRSRESGLPSPPGAYADNVSPITLPFFLSLKCIAREVQIFGGRFAHDEATGENMVLSAPPWLSEIESGVEIDGETTPTIARTYPRKIEQVDAVACSEWLESHKATPVPVGLCVDALRMLAWTSRFDSVRRAFSKIPAWDGVERFSLLPAMLGLQPTDAAESVLFATLVGAWLTATLHRIHQPGAILDDVLFIEEIADINGTVRALSRLLPPGTVSRVGADFDPRYARAEQRILGKTLIVVADFAGASAARTETLASFAVRPNDGRDSPLRRCGFAVLSSSRTDFVPSEFVSVRGGEAPQPLLDTDVRDQILAEAIAKIATMPAGRPSRTTRREPEDGWDVPVRKWLHREVRTGTEAFTISVILRECIKLSLERQVPAHAARIGRILRACGFRRSRARDLTTGDRPSVWRPPAGFARSVEELAIFAAEAAAEDAAAALAKAVAETAAQEAAAAAVAKKAVEATVQETTETDAQTMAPTDSAVPGESSPEDSNTIIVH